MKLHGQRTTLELTNNAGLFATTPIAIGTPPQEFNAVIDIGASDTFVPGPDCARHVLHCRSDAIYNPFASGTYKHDGRWIAIDRSDRYTVGTWAADVFRMGGVVIAKQVFEVVSAVERRIGAGLLPYDTVLGLAKENVRTAESSLQTKSSFQLMVEQSALERDIFGLKLPGADGSKGTLTLGWVDETLNRGRRSARLPLINSGAASSQHYPSGGWVVEATSLSLESENEEQIVFHALSGYSAIFSTVEHFSKFPADFVYALTKLLAVDHNGTVDCAKTKSAPAIVVSLPGTGASLNRLVISPEDYIRAAPLQKGEAYGRCQLAITPLHQDRDEPRQSITLGYSFLQRYYSVFDADARMISLVEL